MGSGNIVPTVSITASDVVFSAQAGSGTIEFEADGPVSVTSSKEWCKVNVNGNVVEVTVTANENVMGRAAEVKLTSGNYTARAVVQQSGFVFKYADGESELLGWRGETFTLPGSCTFAPQVASDVAWLTAQTTTNGNVQVTVAETDTPDPRSGSLIVTLGDNKATYVVTQAGWPFELTDASQSVGYQAGSFVLDGDCAKAPSLSSDVEWLSAAWESGVVTVSYAANPYVKERTGKVTVSAGSKSAVVEVKQAFELNFAGTYAMSFFTKHDESVQSAPEVTLTKDAGNENLYHLTGIAEGKDWTIPVLYEASSNLLKIANAQVYGTEGEYFAAGVISYTNGTSNYVSYSTSDDYALYLNYTIDEQGKLHLAVEDTGERIGSGRTILGLNIYAFTSGTDIVKDNRKSSILLVRKPVLVQK